LPYPERPPIRYTSLFLRQFFGAAIRSRGLPVFSMELLLRIVGIITPVLVISAIGYA
jgi:hypothetical protein